MSTVPLPTEPNRRLLELAKHYVTHIKLNHSQLDSFNFFCTTGLNNVVLQFDKVRCLSEYVDEKLFLVTLWIDYVNMHDTELDPADCLTRLKNYTAAITCTVNIKVEYDGEVLDHIKHEKFPMGRLPIQVLSHYCRVGKTFWIKHTREEQTQWLIQNRLDQNDIGGYFIIDGAEKIIIAQERLNNSTIYVFGPDDRENIGKYRSDKPLVAECRSHDVKKSKQEMFSLTYSPVVDRHTWVVRATLPKFNQDFPLFILLRALLYDEAVDNLVFTSSQDLTKLLMQFSEDPNDPELFRKINNALEGSERESDCYFSPKDCINYIGQRSNLPEERDPSQLLIRIKNLVALLNEIFPHIYEVNNNEPLYDLGCVSLPPKVRFILFMLYRLLQVVLGREPCDDRDHYANKRIDTAGTLVRALYRHTVVKGFKELQKVMVPKCKDASNIIKKRADVSLENYVDVLRHEVKLILDLSALKLYWNQNLLEWEFQLALKTGNFNRNTYASATASSVVMKSVSQPYKRNNYICAVTEQRRLNLPMSVSTNNTRPRQVHPSQYMICIAAGTNVTVDCGIGRKIENLIDIKQPILSYDESSKSLKADTLTHGSTGLYSKGPQNVVRITLVDGRQLYCTADHKVMTATRGWVCAKDLIWGQNHSVNMIVGPAKQIHQKRKDVPLDTVWNNNLADELVMGPDSVLDNPDDDSKNDADWQFTFEDVKIAPLKFDTPQNRWRSLAFGRLLGATLTDAYIGKKTGFFSLGTLIDVKSVQNDLMLFCNKTMTPHFIQGSIKRKDDTDCPTTVWRLRFPRILCKALRTVPGLMIGDSRGRQIQWPDMIFHTATPKAMVREILASAMGGDGWTASLYKDNNHLSLPAFGQSVIKEYQEQGVVLFRKLKTAFERIGLTDITFTRTTVGADTLSGKKNPGCQLFKLRFAHILQCSQHLGYRYCWYKQFKLSVIASFVRLSRNVKQQRAECFRMYYNYIDKHTANQNAFARRAYNQMVKTKCFASNNELYNLPILHHQSQLEPKQFVEKINDFAKNARKVHGLQFAGEVNRFMELKKFNVSLDDILRLKDGESNDGHGFYHFGLHTPVHEYLATIGASGIMLGHKYAGTGQHQLDLPTYHSPVVEVKLMDDVKQVYDISVQNHNSFLANSVIVHNCDCHQTPESEAVGLMKHMAMALYTSEYIDTELIKTNLIKHIIQFRQTSQVGAQTWILLNGNIMGAVARDQRQQFYHLLLIELKNKLAPLLSIYFQRNGRILHVNSDDGRCCRLVINLNRVNEWLTNTALTQYPSIPRMIEKEWLKWVDVAETGDMEIATTWKQYQTFMPMLKMHYHHMEIHPSLMSSFSVNLSPYSAHNQAPRVSYQSAMNCQGIGAHTTNIVNERDDARFDNLDYPQRTLTESIYSQLSFAHDMPSSVNAVVAIVSLGGNNQEDAVIVNQRAVDLGLFRSTRYRSSKDQEIKTKKISKNTIWEKDHIFSVENSNTDSSAIDDDGLVSPGFAVVEDDILMHKVILTSQIPYVFKDEEGKIVTKPKSKPKKKRTPVVEDVDDDSMDVEEHKEFNLSRVPGPPVAVATRPDPANRLNMVKFHDPAVVDRVIVTEGDDNQKLVKVRLRSNRVPQIGDKLASRGPQKGVIAEFRPPEDMPFTSDGVTPDLCLIPNCAVSSTKIHTNVGAMTVKDVVESRESISVVTVNKDTGYTSLSKIHTPFCLHNQAVKKITLANGQSLTLTSNHPVLVYNGGDPVYKRTDMLTVSDYVAYSHMPTVVLSDEGELPTDALSIYLFKIVAKLVGFSMTKANDKTLNLVTLMETNDLNELSHDLDTLGGRLEATHSILTKVENTYALTWFGRFSHDILNLVQLLRLSIKDWLPKSPSSVKACFLYGYWGGSNHKVNLNNRIISVPRETNIDILQAMQDLGMIDVAHCPVWPTYFGILDWAYNSRSRKLSTPALWHFSMKLNTPQLVNKMVETKLAFVKVLAVLDNGKEDVYDFTTVGSNHNFVAQTAVIHNCLPSRQTGAQYLSLVAGIVASMTGKIINCTNFQDEEMSVEEYLQNEMVKSGFHPHGSHHMTDGRTGLPLKGLVFMGVCDYMRMPHQVVDKYHIRQRGQIQQLTRQPTEGRSSSGGLRLGEMEANAIVVAGASQFLTHKFSVDSDGMLCFVCKDCGGITNHTCPAHPNSQLDTIHIPYCAYLLISELRGLNLNLKIKVGS